MRGPMLVGAVSTMTALLVIGGLFFSRRNTHDVSLLYLLDGVVEVANNVTFTARPDSFGPLPPVLGSEHPLQAPIRIVDGLACSPVDKFDVDGAIAVVLRGGCSFYSKVLNLQNGGAKAVIVGNNVDSSLVSMYTTTTPSEVMIPSVFVSRNAFIELSNYDWALVAVLPQSVSVVSSMILFVLSPLLSLSLVYAVLAFQRHRDKIRMRAPKSVVEALPVHKWGELERHRWTVAECVICLEEFDKTATVMTLPCDHEFHSDCVTRWLLGQRKSCPICKKDVTCNTEVDAGEA